MAIAACTGHVSPAFTPNASPGPAIVDGQIVSDFPRILVSIPWGQPIENIARFNAVMGGWSYAGAFEEVRAANPNILIFEATSGCEMGFDPDQPASNATIRSMPPEWFLTQVGSELAAPVDATTTTFEVEATTITDGDETVDLFVVGDALLVDTESVLVTAVDRDARLLTVERGYVRPASPHPAGTRIAAHVMTWPNSWIMNVSTLSPKAIGPGSPGEETFAEYNARVGVDLVHGSNADGLFIDRTDPRVSDVLWYNNIRTIDPDQSNVVPTDYAELDRAWGEGLRVYERLLRDGVGDDTILYANRGMPNLDLLNGYHAENFPRADGTTYGDVPWTEVMFGETGYFAWLEGAQEPRFTVIQTYQDDLTPHSTGGSAEVGALQEGATCTDPGYEPDYRAMRFGLTTTLLGDGYFDFEWSTYAQSWRCLFWFDEYDNAGQSTGYLGQPLGDAYQPLAQEATPRPATEGPLLDSVQVWRRDFEGGTVLVNASACTQTIPLDGRFQRIAGTQDPKVNDGSIVTAVTLPPLDGIILIRLTD